MSVIKYNTELRGVLNHGSVADAVTKLELLGTTVNDEELAAKVEEHLKILNRAYEDFNVALREHHRKALSVLCQQVEDAVKDSGEGSGSTVNIINSMVGCTITDATVDMRGGATIRRRSRRDEG